jgi:hypothetical protein
VRLDFLAVGSFEFAQTLLVRARQRDPAAERATHRAQDGEIRWGAVDREPGAHLAHLGDLGEVALGQVR